MRSPSDLFWSGYDRMIDRLATRLEGPARRFQDVDRGRVGPKEPAQKPPAQTGSGPNSSTAATLEGGLPAVDRRHNGDTREAGHARFGAGQ